MALHEQPEWRDRMRVRFDFNNAMADTIGPEHGVSEEEVNALAGRVRHSHEGLRRRRAAGDLSWTELPYATDVVRKALSDRVGRSHADRIVCTTDPREGELRKIVESEGYRSFDVPPGVGGRFSVLSPVGLLSAAITGIDVSALLAGAAYADAICNEPDVWRNPAYMNAALHYVGYRRGKTLSVMMPYAQSLRDVADWYCQLWAESLGKARSLDGQVVNVGPTP